MPVLIQPAQPAIWLEDNQIIPVSQVFYPYRNNTGRINKINFYVFMFLVQVYECAHTYVTEHDRSSLLSILLARQLDRAVYSNAFILMNIVLPVHVPSRRATYPRFVCFVHQRAVFIEPRDKQQQSNDSRNPLLLFS